MDLSYINDMLAYGDYQLNKTEIIYLDKTNGKTYSIMLDLIICDTLDIPQMDPDFSVNKLLMTGRGFEVYQSKFSCEEIIEQIERKETLCNSTISEKRYIKMAKKGWNIKMSYSTFTFKLRINDEDEHCIICLEQLKVGELEVSPKECNCKYSYCKECLDYTLKTTDCLMCKKKTCVFEKEWDIDMYNKYKLLS
jgi:hypothetical protein